MNHGIGLQGRGSGRISRCGTSWHWLLLGIVPALVWALPRPLAAGCTDEPEISIADAAPVIEGDGGQVMAVFDVSISPPDFCDTDVCAATEDGTATEGSDYQGVLETLAFTEGGPDILQVQVPVNGDLLVELDEDFFVNLGIGACIRLTEGGIIVDGQGRGVILNDDTLPTLSIDDVSVTEGDAGTTDATFTVTLTGVVPPGSLVTVDFASSDGTATTADGDYEATSGSLVFTPGGPTTQPVVVPVVGDVTNEPDETFQVNLSNAVNATITDGEGVGTILNDDELPTLSINDVSVTEGDAGTTEATFTVTLDGSTAQTVTVAFATSDGTATTADDDYEEVSGSLTFRPFDPPTQPIRVLVNGDLINEPDETFQVDLMDPINATITDGQGIGTILNDDGLPVISIDDVSVAEGDAGTTSAVFTVSIAGAFSQPASVRFATHDLTAEVADDDYEETDGTLIFDPQGPASFEVGVPVNGDTEIEPDEAFRLDLRNVEGALLDDHHGLATLRNDDQTAPPGASIVRLLPAPPVPEAGRTATVTVERSGGEGPAEVTVRARGGTAQGGRDFVALRQVLAWAPGEEGPRMVALQVLDDNRQEETETVRVELESPLGAMLGEPSEIEMSILDDDQPTGLVQLGEPDVVTVINGLAELSVQVTSDDGSPVRGAVVLWEIGAGGELLLGQTTTTNAQGNARQEVRLGTTPGLVIVEASLAGTEERVAFELQVRGDLAGLFDPQANPGEASVAGVLDAACVEPQGEFAALCDYLFSLGDDDQRRVVGEATPLETSAQGTMTLDLAAAQLRAVGSRLAALRGSGTRTAVDQIAFVVEDEVLPLQELRYAVARFEDEEAWAAQRIASAVQEAGGREEPAQAPGEVDVDRESRLGFFLSGRIAFGDRPRTAREEGFEAEVQALTAGIDYRVGDRFVFGGALGYLDTEVDLDADGGGLDAEGYSLTGYWTYFRRAFYAEGTLAFANNDFAIERHIDLPVPFLGQTRLTATADPGGEQVGASLGTGYDLVAGTAGLEGFARASWVDASVDGYTEGGAGPFNLAIRAQDLESLLSEVGVNFSYATSMGWGVLQPTLRAAYLHEFEDASRLIRGRFVGDVQANEFVVPTDDPDRDFFNVSAGLTAVTPRGRSFFLTYDVDLERDDFDLWGLGFGVRLEL